jgi:hypothetical protein
MPFNPASRFIVSGAGIDGAIDIASVSGEGVVSLTVDGRALRDPSVETTREASSSGLFTRKFQTATPWWSRSLFPR